MAMKSIVENPIHIGADVGNITVKGIPIALMKSVIITVTLNPIPRDFIIVTYSMPLLFERCGGTR